MVTLLVEVIFIGWMVLSLLFFLDSIKEMSMYQSFSLRQHNTGSFFLSLRTFF